MRAIGLAFARDGRLDLMPPVREHASRSYRPEGEDSERWQEHYLSLLRNQGRQIGTSAGIGVIERLVPEFPNLEFVLKKVSPSPKSDPGPILTGLTRLMSYTGVGSLSIIYHLAEIGSSARVVWAGPIVSSALGPSPFIALNTRRRGRHSMKLCQRTETLETSMVKRTA